MVRTARAGETTSVLKALTEAVAEIGKHERSTMAYAVAIERTAECIELKIKRKDIARAIMAASSERRHGGAVSRGQAARYVMLARIHLRRFRKDWKAFRSVTIGSWSGLSPIDALKAQVDSFSQVFLAFRNAVKPPAEAPTLPGTVAAAIKQAIPRWRVRIGRGGQVQSVRVTETSQTIELAISVLRALLVEKRKTAGRGAQAKTAA